MGSCSSLFYVLGNAVMQRSEKLFSVLTENLSKKLILTTLSYHLSLWYLNTVLIFQEELCPSELYLK